MIFATVKAESGFQARQTLLTVDEVADKFGGDTLVRRSLSAWGREFRWQAATSRSRQSEIL